MKSSETKGQRIASICAFTLGLLVAPVLFAWGLFHIFQDITK